MEPEGSLSFSQEPATELYREAVESSAHSHILYFKSSYLHCLQQLMEEYSTCGLGVSL